MFERVFSVERDGGLVPTPQPDVDAYLELSDFRAELRKVMPVIPPVSTEQFVDRYQGRRRTIYSNARDILLKCGLQRKHSYLSSFVKSEKTRITAAKPDPAPRLIQPRNPVYNIALGCHIAHLEKPLYRAIGKVWGGPTVMKGYNAQQTAQHMRDMWEEFHDPVAVGLDASRFDQHVSEAALKWEHSVYLNSTPKSSHAELKRLLSWQVENKGFIRCDDGTMKYQIRGCRMSGDMNTAMGNCLLMCALVWEFVRQCGIRARLANNGDDCVLFMEREDLCRIRDLPRWFLSKGFTMKVEEAVDVFEQIEFCQTHPVWDGVGWVMCRDPRVCLAKDAMSTLDMTNERTARGWYTAVGSCGLSLTGGLPVLQSFYAAYQRGGRGVTIGHNLQFESGFFHLARGMKRQVSHITDASRVSFYAAFGITPTAQRLIESKFDSWEPSVSVSRGITPNPIFPTLLLHC